MVNIDFSEFSKLTREFEKAGALLETKGSQIVRKTAFDIENDAKTKAPVDTGNLQNSIATQIEDGGLAAEVTASAHYAGYVEHGTSKMAPQPYMGPAADRHLPMLEQAAEQLAAKGIGG
jgi:HK97 gp10 family phage protein